MIKKAKLDSYRMMNLWVDEIPDDCKGGKEDIACIYKANKDITWFSGILCLELRLAPRDASNYAMLNFKFTENSSGNFKILYKQSKEDNIVISDIAAPEDIVRNGIVKNYYNALAQLFDELSAQNIFPSGILEILGGRHGIIGSSDFAVTTVAKILINLFEEGEKLKESDFETIILEGCKRKIKDQY